MVDQRRERVDNYERCPLRDAGRGRSAQQGDKVRKTGTCVVGEGVQPVEGRILALSGSCADNRAQTLNGQAMEPICGTESASHGVEKLT